MGLDFVEIMLFVEDHFGIDFKPSPKFHEMKTMGDLIDMIDEELRSFETNEANFQRSYETNFARFQAILASVLQRDVPLMSPSTKLVSIIPTRFRFVVWERITTEIYPLPPLTEGAGCSIWGYSFFLAFLVCCFGSPILFSSNSPFDFRQEILSFFPFLSCFLIVSLGCFFILKTIQKYCCVWFPKNFQTVDSLIEYLTKKRMPRRKNAQTPWTRKEIENDLLDFISRDFAIPRNKLTVHSTFKEYDLF